MAVSGMHRGWVYNPNKGILGATLIGPVKAGQSVLGANTALDGILLGTPVSPAVALNTIVISNMVASGDILIAANNGGNSQAYLFIDASATTMTLYTAGVSAIAISAAQVVTLASGISTGDFKLNLTLTAGADGVGAATEQLTSGGAAAECTWAAAGCLREYKNLKRERTDEAEVLAMMLATPVYDFQYKEKSEALPGQRIINTGDTKTMYTGVMADDAPWVTQSDGRIFTPVSAFGHTVLAIRALQAQIDELKKGRKGN